jgi:hypothetical protein
MHKALIRDMLDYLYELQGEWEWKLTHPSTKKEYYELLETIRKSEEYCIDNKC